MATPAPLPSLVLQHSKKQLQGAAATPERKYTTGMLPQVLFYIQHTHSISGHNVGTHIPLLAGARGLISLGPWPAACSSKEKAKRVATSSDRARALHVPSDVHGVTT